MVAERIRGTETATDYRFGKRWFEVEMTPADYARLIGHSESYVRTYVMRDPFAEKVRVRIPTSDFVEDICDVRSIGKGETNKTF